MLVSSTIPNIHRVRKSNFSSHDSSLGVVGKKLISAVRGNGGFHDRYSNTEAARADEIRVGLEACYDYADKVK